MYYLKLLIGIACCPKLQSGWDRKSAKREALRRSEILLATRGIVRQSIAHRGEEQTPGDQYFPFSGNIGVLLSF